jgi:predicted 3-demethylubiquinone-9 3-methyltransferase (glyoxalase superfamily)
MSKMTICLWFDHGNAREAAEFGRKDTHRNASRFPVGGSGTYR